MKIENLILRDCLKIEDELVIGDGKNAIIGSNGTGKSTLLRILSGIVFPDKGVYEVEDSIFEYPSSMRNKINIQKKIRKSVMYIENSFFLFDRWTINQNIQYYLELGDFEEKVIYEVLDNFHITEIIDEEFRKISLGTKQKLLISMLLGANKKYLLMDEPTLGLDKESKNIFLDSLEKMSNNHVFVFSTNDREILDDFNHFIICENNEVKNINENPNNKISI